jgi:hypothetical protein
MRWGLFSRCGGVRSVGWRVARMDDVLQCAAVVICGPSVGVAAALLAFSSLSLPELRRWAKGELPVASLRVREDHVKAQRDLTSKAAKSAGICRHCDHDLWPEN